MRIKGRALSKNQRDANSWRVEGRNAIRKEDFNSAIGKTKPLKPKTKKYKKGLRTFTDKQGRLVVKFPGKKESKYACYRPNYLTGGFFNWRRLVVDPNVIMSDFEEINMPSFFEKMKTQSQLDFENLLNTSLFYKKGVNNDKFN